MCYKRSGKVNGKRKKEIMNNVSNPQSYIAQRIFAGLGAIVLSIFSSCYCALY
jgi:hypothetical protein